MAIPLILLLVVLWAAAGLWLIPPMLRGRGQRRPADSVGDFSYRLGVIGKTGGHERHRPLGRLPQTPRPAPSGYRPVGRPGAPLRYAPTPSMTPAQRRRRDVLLGLMVVAVVTLAAGVVTGATIVWGLFLVSAVLLLTYILALLRMQQAKLERDTKVRYLPGRAPVPQFAYRQQAPALSYRRSASS
ncbi:MAG: hypothetical protein JWL73_3803 [Actinomycetia bacterium]|nr:hypothetical protein [Actinomycetes bacterium]